MPAPALRCPHCQSVFQTPEGQSEIACPGCGRRLVLPAAKPPEPTWYYAQNKQKVGPVSLQRLRQLVTGGQLQPTDMVLQTGSSRWCPAGSQPEIFPPVRPKERFTPAPLPSAVRPPPLPAAGVASPAPNGADLV